MRRKVQPPPGAEDAAPAVELLTQVLQRANIHPWDLVLIGDGSGSTWEAPCGWAATLVDAAAPPDDNRWVYFGAASQGSVNMAELMPYLMALTCYHHARGEARLKVKCPLDVHIITDSQVTAGHGQRAANPVQDLPRVPQRALWAGIREFARLGYNFHWHWAPRSTSSLNVLADLVAAIGRRELIRIGKQPTPHPLAANAAAVMRAAKELVFADPETGQPIDVRMLNPYTG